MKPKDEWCIENDFAAQKEQQAAHEVAIWKGPGEYPHHYSPDIMAQGDCRICGHTARSHRP